MTDQPEVTDSGDSSRKADDVLYALNSQFNSLKLLEESLKRRKAAGGNMPKGSAP